MDGILRSVTALLRADVSLATSADRLLAALRRGHHAAVPSRTQLLRELGRHPETFRILTPRRGPWHTVVRGGDQTPFAASESAATPVVIPLGHDEQPYSVDGKGSDLLMRSLYWLGSALDEDSPREIARWVRLANSCARTVHRLGPGTPPASPSAPA